MVNSKNDPLTDWNGFFEEIQNESPRAAVIIAGAFLDEQLKRLISNFLVDDPKAVGVLLGSNNGDNAPISSFSARIKMAYCLGLISKSVYDDLNTIRKIRNNFAHKMHGYSFNDKQIVEWCNNLKLAKMLTDVIPTLPNSHANKFILGVTQLVMRLGMKIIQVKDHRLSLGK